MVLSSTMDEKSFQFDAEMLWDERYLSLLGQLNSLKQELKKAQDKEQRLSRQLDQASEENEQLNEYIATIAHEMNNPLHVASSYITYLLKQQTATVGEVEQDYLKAATSGIKQAQVLLEDLLCDSQMTRQQLDVELKMLDLRSVVGEVFGQFKLMCQTAGLRLTGIGLSGPACLVLGSSHRLQQVLFNLLTNAIKYSPVGGEIQVNLTRRDDDYLVEVVDQGPGISRENQAKIFERRYQVLQPSGHYRAGYGLGLNIAFGLIELQGGSIGVESEVGQGSRFWFSLPAVD